MTIISYCLVPLEAFIMMYCQAKSSVLSNELTLSNKYAYFHLDYGVLFLQKQREITFRMMKPASILQS